MAKRETLRLQIETSNFKSVLSKPRSGGSLVARGVVKRNPWYKNRELFRPSKYIQKKTNYSFGRK